MKLQELLTNNYDYFVKNVGESTYMEGKAGLGKAALLTLDSMTDNIRIEIDKRKGMPQYDGPNDDLNKLRYISSRLHGWIDSGSIFNNKDADVFVHSYAVLLKGLKNKLATIDDLN